MQEAFITASLLLGFGGVLLFEQQCEYASLMDALSVV
jgi:hypothetical protein